MRRLLAVAALTIAPSLAMADAIDSDWQPPECPDELECPAGSSPASLGHSSCPSVCAPNAECQTDADCTSSYGERAHCEPTRFCIDVAYSGPGMSESVVDACDPSGPCGQAVDPSVAEGDRPRCSEVRRCVAPPAPPAPPSRGGCAGCSVTQASEGTALLLSAIAIFLFARRRR